MSIYSDALQAYLKTEGSPTQQDLADAAGCTQAAISRYAGGERHPPRPIAEKIDAASGGHVSLALWRVVTAERAGLAA